MSCLCNVRFVTFGVTVPFVARICRLGLSLTSLGGVGWLLDCCPPVRQLVTTFHIVWLEFALVWIGEASCRTVTPPSLGHVRCCCCCLNYVGFLLSSYCDCVTSKWADITHSGNAEFGCMTNSESIVAPRTDPNNHKIILARVGRWGGCSKRVYGIA